MKNYFRSNNKLILISISIGGGKGDVPVLDSSVRWSEGELLAVGGPQATMLESDGGGVG